MEEQEFHELTEEELDAVTGGRNWLSFGKCILSHGGEATPALATLILHIITFNWAAVAVDVKTGEIASIPVVQQCMAQS